MSELPLKILQSNNIENCKQLSAILFKLFVNSDCYSLNTLLERRNLQN